MKRQSVKKQPRQSKLLVQDPAQARAYAFLLLKYRLRSEKELRTRLKQKGYTEELATQTVNFLKDREFIDDRVFARGWVSSRLKRPLGKRRIKLELAQKGVAPDVVGEVLGWATQDYSESQTVAQLAKKRFSKLKGIEPLKAKARVYGYLIRRGFAPDLVGEAMRSMGKEID